MTLRTIIYYLFLLVVVCITDILWILPIIVAQEYGETALVITCGVMLLEMVYIVGVLLEEEEDGRKAKAYLV